MLGLAEYFSVVLNTTPEWKETLGTFLFYNLINYKLILLCDTDAEQNSIDACACNNVLIF